MAIHKRPYEIRESEQFQKDLKFFHKIKVDIQTLEDVLSGVRWALRENPEACAIVPETKNLRMIKTNRADRGTASVPMLRIWFSIEDDVVILLNIEALDFSL